MVRCLVRKILESTICTPIYKGEIVMDKLFMHKEPKTDYEKVRKEVNYSLQSKGMENNRSLTGYQYSEKESKMNDIPKESMRLGNTFGGISIGSNKKKELLLVVTGRMKGYQSPDRNSKLFVSERAVRINSITDKMYTNSSEKNESAFAYRVPNSNNEKYIMRRLKGMFEKENHKLTEDMLPFLNQKKEKEEIRVLEEQRKNYEQVMTDRQLDRLNKRLTTLQYDLTHKKQEEQRFTENLKKALLQIQKESKKTVYWGISQGLEEEYMLNNGDDSEEETKDM